MKKILLIILAAAVSGCSLRDKIRVTESPNIHVESVSHVVMTVGVENSSRRDIRITEGRFRLHTPNGDIATALLQGEVVIPRRSNGTVALPLRVKFNNPLAILGNVLSNSELLISGEAVARMGAVRKKIRVENTPVSEFLDKFAQ